MPIKLRVFKEDVESETPAEYLFEREHLTIGRGRDNDLTIPDQKVNEKHLEIRRQNGKYVLVDHGNEKKTYVDGSRFVASDPSELKSGDVFRVGNFRLEFVSTSDHAPHQACDDEEVNPFKPLAHRLAVALEELVAIYESVSTDDREEAFTSALRDEVPSEIKAWKGMHLLSSVLTSFPPTDGAEKPVEEEETPSVSDEGTESEAGEPVLDTVLERVLRMVRIPAYFWREFTGRKVVPSSPEAEFLRDASPAELREYLLDETVSEKDRAERLEYLGEAIDRLVRHNMAMLAGYKKAVMAGSKDLLQRVNPIDAVEEAEPDGVVDAFFGRRKSPELDKLDETWTSLFHGEWGELESNLFRPTYIETYVDHMSEAWDVDREKLRSENS